MVFELFFLFYIWDWLIEICYEFKGLLYLREKIIINVLLCRYIIFGIFGFENFVDRWFLENVLKYCIFVLLEFIRCLFFFNFLSYVKFLYSCV